MHSHMMCVRLYAQTELTRSGNVEPYLTPGPAETPPSSVLVILLLLQHMTWHPAPYCTDSNVDIVLENPSTCCPLLHRQQCGYCIGKPQHMLPPTAQTAMWILYCKTPAHAAPYCTDSNVDIVLENPSMLPPTAQTAMWILYWKTPAHAAPYCTDSNVDIVLENPSTCCPLLHRQQCGYCIGKPQHMLPPTAQTAMWILYWKTPAHAAPYCTDSNVDIVL